MSALVLSMQCATTAQIGLMRFDVEPSHEACPGSKTRPGVMGGWTCSCFCHRSPAEQS